MTEKKQSIGALWINTAKNGTEYFAGNINGKKVVVFKNDYKKEGEKSPDFRIFESGDYQKSEQSEIPVLQAEVLPAESKAVSFEDDEIPF